MATLKDIEAAFIRAHEAGDREAAQALADVLRANMPQQANLPQQRRVSRPELQEAQPGSNDDAGFFENVLSGIGAGFVGTAESASLGAATLLEEEEELRAREKIQSVADRFMPEGGDRDDISYKVASGLGSLAGFLVPAAAGVAAGVAGAPAAVASGIGLLGAGALGIGAGAGEASERARAYGATEEERNMATLRGAAIGSLEILPLGRILRIPGVSELGKRIGGETIEEGGSRIRRAFTTGGEEAAQEAAAGFLQNLNERGYNAEAELLNSGLIDEAIAGGGAGAILQAVVDTFTKGRIRAQERRVKAVDEAETAEIERMYAEEAAQAAEAESELPTEEFEDATDDEIALAEKALQDAGQEATPENMQRAVRALRNQDKGMGTLADASPEELDVAIRELVEVDGREMESLTEAEVKAKVDALRSTTIPDDAETAEIQQLYAEEAAAKVPTPDPELPIADQIEQARGTANMLEELAIEAETGSLEEAQLVAQAERAKQNLAEIESRRPAKQEETPVNREEAELAENVRAIDDTRALEQQRTTAEGRAAILQETIDTSNATDFNVLARDFSARLAEAGYGNTRPTARELITARRALAVKAAQPVTPKVEPAPVDEAADVAPIEAQIPEKQTQQREPEQPSFPGMGRKRQPAATQAAAPEAAPEVTPEIVTADMLDGFGVSPAAPVRKRVVGKDIAAPEVREELIKFANNPKVAQQTRQNVTRKLEGTPDAQLELFQPTKGKAKDAPRTATVEPTAAVTQERGASPEPADVPVGGRAPEPVRGRDTERPAAPDRQRVDEPKPDARAADARESTERDTLEAKPTEQPEKRTVGTPVVSKEVTARVRAAASKAKTPAKAAEKPAEAKPAAVKDADKPKPAAKKPAEAKPAAKKEAKPIPAEERGKAANEKRIAAAVRSQAKTTEQFTTMAPKERATNEDKAKIAEATKRVGARDAEGKAISAYLGRSQRVVDGLLLAIHDSVFKTPTFSIREGTTDADVAQYAGTGKYAADKVLAWARENLSPEANKFIREQEALAIAEANRIANRGKSVEILAQEEARDGEVTESEVDAAAEATIDELERRTKLANDLFDVDMDADPDAGLDKILSEFGFDLTTDAVAASSIPLHPGVTKALEAGDLKYALNLLALTNPNKTVQNAAKKLISALGNTKVEMVTGLKNDLGNEVAGSYDAETDTIKLDTQAGANTHAVLHEAVHAVVSKTLTNKSHPLTKQLNKLFNEVKGEINTAYGSTNLDEFVAEVFSNPEFRDMLSRISTDKEGTSAIQKIATSLKTFVRRLLGLPQKSKDSVLDRADMLVDMLLSPNPDSSLVPISGARGKVRALSAAISKVQDGIMAKPGNSASRQFVIGASSFLNTASKAASSAFLGFLDGQLVGDIAAKYGLGSLGGKLFVATQNMRGAIEIADDAFKKKLIQVEKWKKKAGATKYKALNDLIYSPEHGATIYQVDPTLTRAEAEKKYKGQTDASGNSLMDVWDAQRADWDALGKDGQEMYVLMRDTYRDMYNKLKRSIDEQIDATLGKDSPAANKMKLQVFEQMFGKNSMEIYFPLVRNGAFKMEYNDNGERVFRSFESRAERDFAAKSIAGREGITDLQLYNQGVEKTYLSRPPAGFVKDVLDVLKANKVEPAIQEQIVQMFIETLPETSFAKSLQRRKNVQGYEQDSLEAFRRKGFDMSRQTERLRWGSKIRDIARDIANAKTPKSVEAQDAFAAVQEELQARAEFALNGADRKGIEDYVQKTNQLAFVYTIGFNAASAMVNLSQIPLFVMPMLVPVYGAKESTDAMTRAANLVTSAGIGETSSDSKLAKYIPGAKSAEKYLRSGLDSYYDISGEGENVTLTVRTDLDLSPEFIAELESIAPVVLKAKTRGQLGNSHLFDVVGLEEGARAQRGGAVRRKMDQITAISATMFNAAERFNRQTVLVAIYQLELNKLIKENPDTPLAQLQEQAADVSLYKTMEYNGGAHLETAPRWTQQGLGRIAFMYKSYGLRMYSTMLKTAKVMVDSQFAKEDRKAAFQQLVGLHGTALLFAGVQGIPLYGAVQLVADLFLDDEEDDFNTLVRKQVKEGWYKGPLTEFLGLDAGSRMRLSGLLIQANRFNPNASPEETIIHHIGGPAWSVAGRIRRGVTGAWDGELERGIEQMLPAGLANFWKASPYGRYGREGGMYTRRGDPIYTDYTTGEMIGQMIGFAPTKYVLQQEKNQRNVNVSKAIVTRRSKLMKEYYVAARTGDYGKLGDVIEEIAKFNTRHPYAGITGETLKTSLKSHTKTSKEMTSGVNISPLMREMVEMSNAEYEEGF